MLKTFAPENAETTLPRYMKKWYHVEFILAEPVSCRETMQKVEQTSKHKSCFFDMSMLVL